MSKNKTRAVEVKQTLQHQWRVTCFPASHVRFTVSRTQWTVKKRAPCDIKNVSLVYSTTIPLDMVPKTTNQDSQKKKKKGALCDIKNVSLGYTTIPMDMVPNTTTNQGIGLKVDQKNRRSNK